MRAEPKISSPQNTLIECLGKKQAIARRLEGIATKTANLQSSCLSDGFLKQNGIKVSLLDLEGKPNNSHDMFYTPCPQHKLPIIPWDEVDLLDFKEGHRAEAFRVNHTLDEISAQLDSPSNVWVEQEFYDKPETDIGVGEYYNTPFEWYKVTEAEAESPSIPHCIVRIVQHTDPAKCLFLRYVRYVEQTIFPLLLISVLPSQARVLQVHFDGEYLRIAKSKLYDFKENNKANYELFTRWMFPTACGDVKAIQMKSEEPNDAVKDQVELYLARRTASVA
ncbi:hypothetical protein BO94DRAFT_566577 [Aspergillus sclerotioniger CBS 115572]|uniref:Uncharacterized protein n=1 Tax=Aspergillus sclerotioniger CBS 115572 TaxID=1450535 RepID=A0A317WLG4_9EURO|nr:hypothetical protein BO94DRAFT_566577 [Aspergillus sclerotioniger CBS 115572]PWY85858.1 hypothetical protein BO94DRAFT_566577 [Aspergillus sclerotioniger CBS 115572]